jgi:hypothetical protein
MKKNLLGIFAVVLALAVSSFTSNKLTTVYFVYQDAGAENDVDSYDAVLSSPGAISGTDVVAWFIGEVTNPNAPEQGEFDEAFDEVDNQYGGNITGQLSDEVTEDAELFELKAD